MRERGGDARARWTLAVPRQVPSTISASPDGRNSSGSGRGSSNSPAAASMISSRAHGPWTSPPNPSGKVILEREVEVVHERDIVVAHHAIHLARLLDELIGDRVERGVHGYPEGDSSRALSGCAESM